ncbi:MAG: GDP-mannose 4,6-dehydratase [Candidatus Xenobia bacterium]|jgi:GDPmannose 4,6-dehydratase
MKKALITGITGQDGSYLAEFLLSKGYEVHGIVRRCSTENTDRIAHLCNEPHGPRSGVTLHNGDINDSSGLRRIVEVVQPDEVYNLGAQSHVKVSFEQPEYTADAVALGTLRVLEAVRGFSSQTGRVVKIYQASSSEMYGSTPPPQNEQTPFHPRSPYAVSKVAAHYYCVNYREAYEMFVCNGILFNHESPRRGETFVTRKITRAVGRIKLGLQEQLYLGNLDARRDWGFAGDYVEAMWLMLQQARPGDYVVGTGESRSVREFVQLAFERVGLDWERYVQVDPRYFRPSEVDYLLADSSRARQTLGWSPKVSFRGLVEMMVDSDLKLAERDLLLVQRGHSGGLRDLAVTPGPA